jgi:hypothetical protein
MINKALPQLQGSLTASPFHGWTTPDGEVWCDFYRLPDGYLLRFPGLADFFVSLDGLRITATPVPDLDDATLDHLYLNQVAPLAMSRQHKLVLHGGAVVINHAAVAFIGRSGQGKSTLVAGFAANGYRFLTDDGLQLIPHAGAWLASPGPASIRLWDDSNAALMPPDSLLAPAISYSSKARLLAGGTLEHSKQALPLRAIYLLDTPTDNSGISITACSGGETLMALIGNSFLLDIEEREVLERHFATLSELARNGIVYRLRYPRDYAQLPAVRTAVCRHVGN